MVNLVAAEKALSRSLIKLAGIAPQNIEIEPGTILNIWVPTHTIKKPKTGSNKGNRGGDSKPVVVLVHGYGADDGMFNWQFQVGSLAKNYSVYVPDLLFFGDSTTTDPDRSPNLQAEYLVKGLKKLDVERCTVVGFSYGGIVAFKMAEIYPELVEALVITGAVPTMMDPVNSSSVEELGVSSLSDLLLPDSVDGVKTLVKVAAYKKFSLPGCIYKDILEVMFNNRKERAELLEGLVLSNKDTDMPKFPQKIHLLWGEDDQIFKLELAQKLKEQLGSNVTLQVIKKAGHLVHLERPCVYNKSLRRFLASLCSDYTSKS